ncbi:iron ABC transporter permease [Pseudonocardia charpentierae]|uniref:Iron ABC transporter permease n=1 Tax=Pseudonocardia charpentierae TaxID=3075545 RepID=A0ABU2NB51_9PSEU|nr:iron ABC transporter permease [Pseudonocardia sp. DSM 45834]MDT0350504.1 iron ABC transporter permease [Pseudonocardia sp. DSM 45834]
MSQLTAIPPVAAPARRLRVASVVVVGLVAAALLAAVHLTQGTADVGLADLVRLLLDGSGTEQEVAVVVASRMPRLLAGVLVGVALGVSGAALQSIARNPLASPDTLGVDAGAYLLLVLAIALRWTLPLPFAGGLAFVGGLAAAALVLTLASGAGSGPTRLVLAGSAIAMALDSVTVTLLLLFRTETSGLFAWGSGSLAQYGLSSVTWMGPLVLLTAGALVALSGRLDIHGLGDDAAAVLGVNSRRLRLVVVLLAVLLAAASVTVAGPIGFVGLAAPAIVRLLGPRIPGLLRHRVLLPVSALSGIVVVLGADVLVRFALGAQVGGVEVPTGVVTSLFGAVFLVVLACRYRSSGPVRPAPVARSSRLRGRRGFVVVAVVVAVAAGAAAVSGLLLGDAWLLTGDLANWVAGRSGPIVTNVLDARVPRVLAALVAGAALAVAGAIIQAGCRNPLAEPGILGVTSGAGLGAVLVLTLVPTAGTWPITGAAFAGAMVASVVVFGLAARGGLESDRLVLIGVGVAAAADALITVVIVLTDPWSIAKALTWLSGSTYRRTLPLVVPATTVLLLSVPLLGGAHRTLDLLAVDDDTPRLVGVRLDRARPLLLGVACLLTATAVSAVGVISFVGLVAPHAARALVGARHARMLPVAALLGALLVSAADTLGRTVIAPGQLPAGLLAALVGTPYFVWLLWRSRSVD